MQDGDDTAITIELWKLCWPVMTSFCKRNKKNSPLTCGICHETSEPAFYSSFRLSAVHWTCQHAANFICAACEEHFFIRVSQQKQQCPERGCPGKLSINLAEIEARVKNKKAFERYRNLVLSKSAECIVCCETHRLGPTRVTEQCRHDRNLCSGCLAQMIEVAVKGGGWDDLRCPDPQCKMKLEYEDIRQASSSQTFNRYDDFLTHRTAKRIPNFTQCNRPGGICPASQIHEAGDTDPQMKCFACGYLSCFSCSAAWHEGQTCSQVHSLLPEDPESEAFKRKYCKRCPGAGCGLYTKKDGLCHEMQCPNAACAVKWCWECKLIMDTDVEYGTRNKTLHLASCNAPLVHSKRARAGYKSVTKPSIGDGMYRSGWDVDQGFVGTGEEY